MAGDRKLAFFLGGSAAFGHFASSDSTTITGYLNASQNEYHFVNAGVPSWNSYQELCRLENQILDYRPELVIAYDGGNDYALLEHFWRRGLDYPAGTPESFDELFALVGDIRAGYVHVPRKPIWEGLFPRVSNGIQRRLFPKPRGKSGESSNPITEPLPDSLISAGVRRYLSNLFCMQAISEASGGRFIGVFQPVGEFHSNAPECKKNRHPQFMEFKRSVLEKATTLHEYLDFSTIFESYPGKAPWLGEGIHQDLGDEVIFVDSFHLYDRGNRIVAQEIQIYLKNHDCPN